MNLQNLLGEIRRVDHDYHLLEKNDRIAIGLSGGKDSMLLLEALHTLSNFRDYSFDIIAIHIDLGLPNMDFSLVDQYCKSKNIEIHHEKSKIYETLLENQTKEKLSCSHCSKYKKACIVQAALKYNCNKIAFAHHADDAIETLFMNMMHGARMSTFQPKMYLNQSGLTFIRPFIYSSEKDINNLVQQLKLPIVLSTCPNDKHTERQYIKEYLSELYQHDSNIRNNFLKMLSNQEQINLWKKTK